MFVSPFAQIEEDLRARCRALRPDDLTAKDAASEIEHLARIERLAAGSRLRLVKRLEDTVESDEGDKSTAEWLAQTTGQSAADAAKELETAKSLDDLEATDEALRNGELTSGQAREVTSAAGADPDSEAGLLETARNSSVPELRREAKKVRAAATDRKDKDDEARRNRRLSSGVDDDTAEGWLHGTGPAARVAEFLALLAPWVQAEYDKARREDRREGSAAYRFDALMAMARWAGQQLKSGGTSTARPNGNTGPAGPPAQILVRVDAAALKRGHAVAGETCEIDGLGPVPVETILEFLPQAGIDLIVTNGVDVFNVTHFGRRANARQQIVLDWLGGACTRQGCPHTRGLQVDHRIDWATIKITELRNLDWLCVADHRRKTHQGWALVAGTGKRRMVPPDHPDHPANAPPGRTQAA